MASSAVKVETAQGRCPALRCHRSDHLPCHPDQVRGRSDLASLGVQHIHLEGKKRSKQKEHFSTASSVFSVFLSGGRLFAYFPSTLTTNLVPLMPMEAVGVSKCAESGASLEMSPER